MKYLLSLLLLPGLAPAVTVQDWALPAPPASAQPNLSVAPDGDLLLTWIERRSEGGHRLAFARQPANGAWSPARTIAQGDDWFVNWADFPALQALADGSLWAHTLVRNGDAAYAYDVRLQVSRDGGVTWTPTGPVHDDGTPTEHGFVTLWPAARDRLGIAWLDGRDTAGGGHDGPEAAATPADTIGAAARTHDMAGHDAADGSAATQHALHATGNAMTLRTAMFAHRGKRDEILLDARTCDCCQTDSAATADGVLLAYRGRDRDEISDIAVARFDGTRWHAPVAVHADGWVMPACPVNGPAVAVHGQQAWVAWYTGAGGTPSVRIAASADGGRSFGPMREIARGDDQHGRVDIAATADGVWVSWLQEAGDTQSLWIARYAPDLGTEHFRRKVADVAGRGRGTGFPRLQLADGSAWLAWTEIVAGQPRLRGARVRP